MYRRTGFAGLPGTSTTEVGGLGASPIAPSERCQANSLARELPWATRLSALLKEFESNALCAAKYLSRALPAPQPDLTRRPWMKFCRCSSILFGFPAAFPAETSRSTRSRLMCPPTPWKNIASVKPVHGTSRRVARSVGLYARYQAAEPERHVALPARRRLNLRQLAARS